MSRSGAKPPSQRQLRVGEELRHALARLLAQGGFRDPELNEANITVTEVQVSPDLRNATAFVTPLGGTALAETVTALNRAAGFVRSRLAAEVRLRYLPRLQFAADRSFDNAMRLQDVLSRPRVQRDLEQAEAEPGADDAPLKASANSDGHHGS